MPVQLPGCRTVAKKPSPLCAIVCLSVVAAHDRRWISAPVSTRMPPGISPERLSRIKAAILPAFEAEISRATRRGRPPSRTEHDDNAAALAASEALLEVAAATIREVHVHGRANQDRLVEAASRLRKEHGISQKRFVSKLGVPERTFRSWAERARSSPPGSQAGSAPETGAQQGAPAGPGEAETPTAESTEKKPPSRNVGRFSLEVSPPGLQAMADTTDIQAFGVKLKLVGAQDTGNRHRKLLESFRVSEAECSQLVLDVVTRAFSDLGGTQLIVDQGTPYMAEATKAALEALEVDHCPQKEGAPTDKAPLERAWRTIKDALEPILGLTDRLAEAIPALRDTTFARAVTQLLVGTFLRVYAAARAPLPHPLDARDPLELVEVVQEAKERARAEGRSKKLLLQSIHARYAMHGSPVRFVRAHRGCALEDIQEAERRLRDRACRCRTRACDRYFAGILSRVSEEGRRRRAAERHRRREYRRRMADDRLRRAREQSLQADPESRLHEGLSLIAAQWRDGRLLFGGKGPGLAAVRKAVGEFIERGPLLWQDEVRAAWHRWAATSRAIPLAALSAINHSLEHVIRERELGPPPGLPPDPRKDILRTQARYRNQRPPRAPHLRI
jgi:DNA-binding transcriptional regulator YiaG